MSISFCWQTWRPDSNCLLESIESVLALGVPPEHCHVWERKDKPLHGIMQEWLDKTGIKRGWSVYHNVKKFEDCYERLKVISLTGKRFKTDYVLRIDSDTVLCNAQRINEAVRDEVPAMSWSWPGVALAGCCSLQRTGVASEMLMLMQQWGRCITPGTTGDNIIAYLLERFFGGHRKHYFDPTGGFGKAWRYDDKHDDARRFASSFDFVTFGNRFLACECDGKAIPDCDAYDECAIAMAKFRGVLSTIEGREPFNLD